MNEKKNQLPSMTIHKERKGGREKVFTGNSVCECMACSPGATRVTVIGYLTLYIR